MTRGRITTRLDFHYNGNQHIDAIVEHVYNDTKGAWENHSAHNESGYGLKWMTDGSVNHALEVGLMKNISVCHYIKG